MLCFKEIKLQNLETVEIHKPSKLKIMKLVLEWFLRVLQLNLMLTKKYIVK